jgi:hypothetical protein
MSGWVAGATVVSGLIGASGARSAASAQSDAAKQSGELQKAMFDEQKRLQEPYRQAGLTGQNRLMELMGLGGNAGAADYGKYGKDFSMADYTADPGYGFRLSEGMKQLSHSAAGRGGLISGSTMKGLQDYAQGSASQEYGNAFARYQAERAARLQSLGNLMSSGQAAASNQAGAAGQYAVNGGNAITAAGNAYAAGKLGEANTYAGALTSAATGYQNQNNFNNWLASKKNPSNNQSTYMAPTNTNVDPYSGVRVSNFNYT